MPFVFPLFRESGFYSIQLIGACQYHVSLPVGGKIAKAGDIGGAHPYPPFAIKRAKEDPCGQA